MGVELGACDGAAVGVEEGALVGACVGCCVGAVVGDEEGALVGPCVGCCVGVAVGDDVGEDVPGTSRAMYVVQDLCGYAPALH